MDESPKVVVYADNAIEVENIANPIANLIHQQSQATPSAIDAGGLKPKKYNKRIKKKHLQFEGCGSEESARDDFDNDKEEYYDEADESDKETDNEYTRVRKKVKTILKKKANREFQDYISVIKQNRKTSNNTLDSIQCIDEKEMSKILKTVQYPLIKEKEELFKQYSCLFYRWIMQMSRGFAVLLYGIGSKKRLLENFITQNLDNQISITINGFHQHLTAKEVVLTVFRALNIPSPAQSDPFELINTIRHQTMRKTKPVYMIIHNIERIGGQTAQAQDVLARLSSLPIIKMIASIDHVNSPLLWNAHTASMFNWICYDCTTFDRYDSETKFELPLTYNGTGTNPQSCVITLRTLTKAARAIFRLICSDSNHLDSGSSDKQYSITFPNLYLICRDQMIITTNHQLHNCIQELTDHKIVIKRVKDGVEWLVANFSKLEIKRILEELNS